ncbi:MAG: hypothetical protein M1337_07110, partial [Actinobacteria bacterium]|nr:hypothetical protein [Actinomycetota bacterium]
MNMIALDKSTVAGAALAIMAYAAWLVFVLVNLVRASRAGDTVEVVGWVLLGVLGPVGVIPWLIIRKPLTHLIARNKPTGHLKGCQ